MFGCLAINDKSSNFLYKPQKHFRTLPFEKYDFDMDVMLLNQCIIFIFMFLVDGNCLGHLDESQNTVH